MLLCVLPWLARCRCHLVWWVVSPAASEAVLAVLGTGWVWAAAVYACVCVGWLRWLQLRRLQV